MPRHHIREINPHTEGPIADKLDEHDDALDALEEGIDVIDDNITAIGQSIYDVWKAEAAADLGIAPSGLIFAPFGDILVINLSQLTAGTGARTATPTKRNGQRLSTGTGAGGNNNFINQFTPFSSNPTALQFLAGANEPFWMKIRMAINDGAGGPVEAGTAAGMIVRPGGGSGTTQRDICMGIDGAVSTTNFVVSGTAGAAMDSGVPIDSLVRDHKVHRRSGDSTKYYIDDVLRATGTARPGVSGGGAVAIFETSITNQVMDVFVAALAFPAQALGA